VQTNPKSLIIEVEVKPTEKKQKGTKPDWLTQEEWEKGLPPGHYWDPFKGSMGYTDGSPMGPPESLKVLREANKRLPPVKLAKHPSKPLDFHQIIGGPAKPKSDSSPDQKGPPSLVEIFPDAVKKAEELLRSEQSLAASIKKIVLEILLLLALIWGIVGLTFFFFEPDAALIPIAVVGSVLAIVYYGIDQMTLGKKKPVAAKDNIRRVWDVKTESIITTFIEAPTGITDEDIQAVLKASAERDLRPKRKVAWKVNRNTILWALWAPALFGLLALFGRMEPGSAIFMSLFLSGMTLIIVDLYRKEKE